MPQTEAQLVPTSCLQQASWGHHLNPSPLNPEAPMLPAEPQQQGMQCS